jgi:putative ABC transport system permease protein
MPRYTPRIAEVRVDLPVFVFAALAAALSGVLCGVLPSLHDARVGPGDALRSQGRSIAGTRSHRLQSGLVVAEVALSIVLLVGGVLMVRSLSALLRRDHGFDPHGVLTLHVTMPFDGRYDGREPRAQGFRDVLASIAALPGVEGVAEVTGFPDSSLGYLGNTSVNADPADPDARVLAALRTASRDYFRVMGIPVLTGRSFDDRGGTEGPTQVVINQTLAKRLWPGTDPVGRRLSIPEAGAVADAGDAMVVGVVGDVRMGAAADPEIYVFLERSAAFWADVVVRTSGSPAALAGAVRRAIRAVDAHILVEDMQPMDRVMADRLALQRAQSFAVGLFAGLALLLAAVGLYGLLTWLVGQRTQEMGVRMALGASRADVFAAVARRGLGLAAWGVAGGLALALGAIHALRAKVFGLDHVDPWSVAAAAALLLGVALVACWLPARRATRVDPVTALR